MLQGLSTVLPSHVWIALADLDRLPAPRAVARAAASGRVAASLPSAGPRGLGCRVRDRQCKKCCAHVCARVCRALVLSSMGSVPRAGLPFRTASLRFAL